MPEFLVAENEIERMREAYLTLAGMTPEGQSRALEWLCARISWEHHEGLKVGAAVASFAKSVQRRRLRAAA